jgi:hypothetical protein
MAQMPSDIPFHQSQLSQGGGTTTNTRVAYRSHVHPFF